MKEKVNLDDRETLPQHDVSSKTEGGNFGPILDAKKLIAPTVLIDFHFVVSLFIRYISLI